MLRLVKLKVVNYEYKLFNILTNEYEVDSTYFIIKK